MEKMVKKSHFLYIFVHCCYIWAFFFFFLLFAKAAPLLSCHRICSDEGNSASGNFRGIFSVQ